MKDMQNIYSQKCIIKKIRISVCWLQGRKIINKDEDTAIHLWDLQDCLIDTSTAEEVKVIGSAKDFARKTMDMDNQNNSGIASER